MNTVIKSITRKATINAPVTIQSVDASKAQCTKDVRSVLLNTAQRNDKRTMRRDVHTKAKNAILPERE